MAGDETIRNPQVAGTFYPADPVELRGVIGQYLHNVPAQPVMDVQGLVVPHAGYRYSGQTAAFAYRTIETRKNNPPEVIVIISPSHREYFRGVSVFPGVGYATPLGVLPVHTTLRSRMLEIAEQNPVTNILSASNRGHGAEHALEVQLPFLQVIYGEIPILPLVMGDQAPEYCFQLGRLLGESLNKIDAIIIASTDLSHFHEAKRADALDAMFIDHVRSFDEHALMKSLDTERTEACGGGPTVAMMSACRILGATKSNILDHRNSGSVTGDLSSVVGYCSATINR